MKKQPATLRCPWIPAVKHWNQQSFQDILVQNNTVSIVASHSADRWGQAWLTLVSSTIWIIVGGIKTQQDQCWKSLPYPPYIPDMTDKSCPECGQIFPLRLGEGICAKCVKINVEAVGTTGRAEAEVRVLTIDAHHIRFWLYKRPFTSATVVEFHGRGGCLPSQWTVMNESVDLLNA